MARRPTNEMAQLNLRVPRGHNGYWAIIRELDAQGPWGVPDVTDRTNADRASVKDYVLRLLRAGIAKNVGERSPKAGKVWVQLYRLTEHPIQTPRVDRKGNRLPEPTIETLWRTMKMATRFTLFELAELASTPERPVSQATVKRYVRYLERSGIVLPIDKSRTTFRLVRNLGARAPIILKTLSLYDPNAGAILGETDAREVQP